MNDDAAKPLRWAALSGRWNFEADTADYLSGSPGMFVEGQALPFGLALSNRQMGHGSVRVGMTFNGDPLTATAGVVVGYESPNERYYFVELGASNAAYCVGEFVPASGWRRLLLAGSKANLQANRVYEIVVLVTGQRIEVQIDTVGIFNYVLGAPLVGRQTGLIAAGVTPVHFERFTTTSEESKVFVAMQYGEPFDTIYREVIQPVCQSMNLSVVRIDEVTGPGIIFEDIKRNISDANIVVAEITAANQNVFYELGYAHALNKPTILLAQRGRELPFDIRSYRVIFYDDSIGGKPQVEKKLKEHLRSVLREPASAVVPAA